MVDQFRFRDVDGPGDVAVEFSRTALGGSSVFYANPTGPQLLGRTSEFLRWKDARRDAGLWAYSRVLRSPARPESDVAGEFGSEGGVGLNFGSQDYLALSQHPGVHAAIREALNRYGPHSAGSPMVQGNTSISLALERAISDHLRCRHVMLFPTGWAAGFGSVTALVREHDWVVMDEFSHACLQAGAKAATRNIRRFKHLRTEDIPGILAEIRAADSTGGILVITEGLFSMDADVPDIGAIQEACHAHSATLMVDIAHDYGAMGPNGTGSLGAQGLLGKVDLVMGSFSKTFATNGGFLATNAPAVRDYVKVFGSPHIFSNAMSPLQAAAAVASLEIVRSLEGDGLRRSLSSAVNALRQGFESHGIDCLGVPSPIVPVIVGGEDLTRLTGRFLIERGIHTNMCEFPVVPRKRARFRFQVMASHAVRQTQAAVQYFLEARAEAEHALKRSRSRGEDNRGHAA